MTRTDHTHRTLQGALRVIALICMAWLSPMPTAAMAGNLPHAPGMVMTSDHTRTASNLPCAGHASGMSHDLACAIACAGSPVIGPMSPLLVIGAVAQAELAVLLGTAATGIAPDPALRPPNASPIA